MKFQKADARYLEHRRSLSERFGARELWSVIDHWPLYCGIANLGRFLAIYEIYKSTLDVPGHVAEFGSWRGSNLMLLAKLGRLFDPHSSKQVHTFDSFEGLTEFSAEDGDAGSLRGEYKGNLEELNEMIELYEMTDEIVIHKGLIEETLPPLMEAQPEISFSIVYCDTDLYSSTALILETLHPRLSKGAVFVLDEWNYENLPGEGVAVREFLERHGDCYVMENVPRTRQPSLVLRKLRTESNRV